MNRRPTPSPIALDGVHALEQFCAIVPEEQELPEASTNPIGHRWDWRFVDRAQFQVRFGLRIDPVASRPEFLQVLMVGTFEILEPLELSAVSRFAATNAPATLVPYIREALATLSMRGPFGPFHLPLLNLIGLSDKFALEAAEGWKQALADPQLLVPAVERTPEPTDDSNVG